MTDPTNAAASLEAAARAQQRARTDARWFPWVCAAAGVLVIPGGTVIPWGWPTRLIVTLSIFALLFGLVLLMSKLRATPRGGTKMLTLAVWCWVILSTLIATAGRNIEDLGVAVACSAAASLPFFVVALRFRTGRSLPR